MNLEEAKLLIKACKLASASSLTSQAINKGNINYIYVEGRGKREKERGRRDL